MKSLSSFTPETVASIAAHLPHEVPAPTAVLRAYELLHHSLDTHERLAELDDAHIDVQFCIIKKITEEKMYHREILKEIETFEDSLPPSIGDRDSPPLPLNDVLNNLMPRGLSMEEKERKFTLWVEHRRASYSTIIKELKEHAPSIASSIMEDSGPDEWKKVGVSSVLYELARNFFPEWQKDQLSKKRSAAGKLGQKMKQAAKGIQGKVKKKTDKRRGAKILGEKVKVTKKSA